MNPTGWIAEEVIRRIRPSLYRYLQGSASAAGNDGSEASEGQAELSAEGWQRLAAVHLSVRPESERLLTMIERTIRRLPRVRRSEFEEAPGLVRGPVSWQRTYARRTATGDRTMFVTRPRTGATFTPLAHLLAETLDWFLALEQLAAIRGAGDLQRAVSDLHHTAGRLRVSPKLPVPGQQRRLPQRLTEAIFARRSDLGVISEFRIDYRNTIHRRDPRSCRSLVDGHLFRPGDDDRLFELLVGHELAAGAEAAGYVPDGDQALIESSTVPFLSLTGPAGRVRIWWQRSYWSLEPDRRSFGAWSRILKDNELSDSANLPDFLVEFVDAHDWLLVEAKWSVDRSKSRDRDGLRDVFSYLRDADAMTRSQSVPRALVVALNSSAVPNLGSDVALMSEESVRTAFRDIAGRRAVAASSID